MIKLTLLMDYVEDNRLSMSRYSNDISQSINLFLRSNRYDLITFIPTFPKWLSRIGLNIAMQMRYARYLAYPRQARNLTSSLWHIVDQSYSHLLYEVDSAKTVVTVHDLIPILGWKGAIPGFSYPHPPMLYMRSIRALKKARAIIAVSKSTKNDLINYCNIKSENIHIVHNAVSPVFRPLLNKLALREFLKLPLNEVCLVLITGTQMYKNHLNSIRAIRVLESTLNKPVQLVWLGGLHYSQDSITELPLSELSLPPILMGHITQEELVMLYNAVDCLLFPSWYEGFGWPPLEAMSCGLPVITSTRSSLPEVVGDAALLVDPADVKGLAEALKLMIENVDIRQEYIDRGFENIKRFSYDKFALSMKAVYDSLQI